MQLGRCHDLSLPLHANVLRYPGDPAPRIAMVASIANGDPLTVSELTLNCHVGTHVDAPAHFIDGAAGIDELALEHFYGPALVVDVGGTGRITAADLTHIPNDARRHLLLKTGNGALLSRSDFDPSYRTLTAEAATHLAALRPLSIGFDYYSVDPPSAGEFPAHRILARAGVPVFLPLRLDGIAAGAYLFVGMPLPLVGTEAAPVRAVVFEQPPLNLPREAGET